MKVTSTRVRIIGGDGIYAIASVTIDKQLTINDIKVERHGNEFTVKMPKTETAKLTAAVNSQTIDPCRTKPHR